MRLVALLALVAASSASADPAPVIRIRARARLTVDTVEKTADGVVVGGALWDDAAGAPVAGKRVRVALHRLAPPETLEAEAATDERGGFSVALPAALGVYQVQAAFLGDGDYAAPDPVGRVVDVALRPVALAVTAPARGSVGAAVPVAVEARVDGAAADLPVRVTVGDQPGRVVSTGAGGRVDVALAVPATAPPGARLAVRAAFDGDAVRGAAVAESVLLVTAPSTLSAEVADPAVHRGDDAIVTGRLGDARGALADQVVVALAADGRPLGQAVTDGAGRFRLAAATRPLAVGEARLAVAYDPPVSYRDAARSPTLALTVLPPAPVPLAATLAPPAATLLLLAAAWAWRKKPWRRLRRRAAVRPADAGFPVAGLPASGVVEARPRITATLRRPHDLGVDGVAWDAWADRPVAAQVHVTGEGGAGVVAACDAAGRFSVENLPAGRCTFTVVAPGYLALRFERDLPHRGELRGVRVQLQPLRAEILSVYRQAALGFLPELRLVEVWTPRELCDHVARQGPLPAPLAALAALLEESYWSPRLPSENALAEAVRLAAQLDAPLRHA